MQLGACISVARRGVPGELAGGVVPGLNFGKQRGRLPTYEMSRIFAAPKLEMNEFHQPNKYEIHVFLMLLQCVFLLAICILVFRRMLVLRDHVFSLEMCMGENY